MTTFTFRSLFTLVLTLIAMPIFAEQNTPMTPSEFFHGLNKDSMQLVDRFYAADAILRDPIGEIKGSARIKAYYAHQYAGAEEIRWEIEPEIVAGPQVVLAWKMHLKTKMLNGGQSFVVPGMSRFVLNEKGQATLHEDYFDVGAFVYERIPIFSSLIGLIKNKLKKGVSDFDARTSK